MAQSRLGHKPIYLITAKLQNKQTHVTFGSDEHLLSVAALIKRNEPCRNPIFIGK